MSYTTLTPVNAASVYSPQSGQSIIRWQIAGGRQLLNSTLRFNGNIRVGTGANFTPPDNATDVYLSPIGGVRSIIHQLTISTVQGEVLARVNRSGRLVACLEKARNSEKTSNTIETMQNGCSQSSEADQATADQASKRCFESANGLSFSLRMADGCGLLASGESWPNHDGLVVEIMLAGNASVLVGADADSTYEYRVTAPTLTCVMGGPSPTKAASYPVSTYSSLFGIFQGSNEQIGYSVGSPSTVRTLATYIKARDQNAYGVDPLTFDPVEPVSIRYSRAGVPFPMSFDVRNSSTDRSRVDPQRLKEAANSVGSYRGQPQYRSFIQSFDAVVGSGVDYSTAPFGYQLESNIAEPVSETRFFLSNKSIKT